MMASTTEFISINSQALEDADDEQLSSCYMLEQDNLFPNFTIGDSKSMDGGCAEECKELEIVPPQKKRAKVELISEGTSLMVTTKDVSEIPSSSPVDSNDNYARNMRKSLTVGMNVRCRQSVQKLSISDTGTVIEIKLVNDLHDYNVKVLWNRKGVYWMRYVEIEILTALASIPKVQPLLKMASPPTPVESASPLHLPIVLPLISGPSSHPPSQIEPKEALLKGTDVLVHATHCRDPSCRYQLCHRMKSYLIHYHSCPPSIDPNKMCRICNQLFIVCQNHAEECTVTSNCPVLLCKFFKKRLDSTEQPIQTPTAQQSPPNSLMLAVKSIYETLKSPQLFAEEQNRIIEIMKSHPQLAEIFNLQRNFLQQQLNQHNKDLSDLHRQQTRHRIQQIGRIFSVLEVGTQPAKTAPSVPVNKSSLLSDLCALPCLDETKMSQFLQLASDMDVHLSHHFLGVPPLSLLLRNNQSDSLLPCLQSLLQRNDVNLENMFTFGHNSLTLVCRYNPTESLFDCVKMLIQQGVNVRSSDSSKRNALLLVCEFYSGEKMLELIKLLLKNGTDVFHENKQGDNALSLICRFYKRGNLIELIRLLILRGVKVDCINSRKQTALHSLCQYYSGSDLLPILKLLVRKGIDATVEDENKETALTLICHYYRHPNLLEIIRFLVIDCGLNVNSNVKGVLNRSAFVIVCNHTNLADGLMDIVRFLSQHLNFATTDAAGRNVLHILCSSKFCKGPKLAAVLRFLIKETRVNVNVIDHSGFKPVDVFRQQKRINLLNLANRQIIQLLSS